VSNRVRRKSGHCLTEQGFPNHIETICSPLQSLKGMLPTDNTIFLALIFMASGKSSSMKSIFQSTIFHNWSQDARKKSRHSFASASIWQILCQNVSFSFQLLFYQTQHISLPFKRWFRSCWRPMQVSESEFSGFLSIWTTSKGHSSYPSPQISQWLIL